MPSYYCIFVRLAVEVNKLQFLTLISHNPISKQFLEGYSPEMIADGLMEDSICTPSGGKKWYPSAVASNLENEKYARDLLMQKMWLPAFCVYEGDHTSKSALALISTPVIHAA